MSARKNDATRALDVITIFGRMSVDLHYDNRGNVSGRIESDLDLEKRDKDIAEAIVLAHACSGVNIKSHAYAAGLDAAFDAILNHPDDDDEEAD